MPSISLAPPNLPLPSVLLRQIRSSCAEATKAAGIRIDEARLSALLASSSPLPSATSKDYSLAFPLKWDSTSHEVNFLSLLAVLSVLSPSESLLRQLPNTPSPSSLPRHLLLGLYLSAPPSNHASAPSPLSSAHLAGLKDGEVADIVGLKIHQEKRVEHIPVATLAERGGPGSEVVSRMRETLNRVGDRCVENRYVDLGAFVAETLGQCKSIAAGKGEEEAVGHFVNRIVSFLPIDTTDAYTLSEDTQVHVYSNALFLLLSLTLRFGPSSSSSSALPWLPSPSIFPLLADGHLPVLLARRGVLDVSECTDRKLRTWGEWASAPTQSVVGSSERAREPALSSDQAHLLRAASIHAGELLRSKVAGPGAGAGTGVGQEEAGGSVLDFDAFLRREGAGVDEGRGLLVEEREIDKCGKW